MLSLDGALAHELRETGVTLTTLCPGPTSSGFRAAADGMGGTSPDRHPRNTMTSADVARRGYLAMKRGRRAYVPGFGNSFRALFSRYAPWLAWVSERRNPSPVR